ncbi:hypothetical protein J6590_071742 [Homalodisca vitripennis]|nr:hypothetical protein J6590_071742 [Homalodisca vitripennis]
MTIGLEIEGGGVTVCPTLGRHRYQRRPVRQQVFEGLHYQKHMRFVEKDVWALGSTLSRHKSSTDGPDVASAKAKNEVHLLSSKFILYCQWYINACQCYVKDLPRCGADFCFLWVAQCGYHRRLNFGNNCQTGFAVAVNLTRWTDMLDAILDYFRRSAKLM